MTSACGVGWSHFFTNRSLWRVPRSQARNWRRNDGRERHLAAQTLLRCFQARWQSTSHLKRCSEANVNHIFLFLFFLKSASPPHRAALSQPRVDVQSVVVFHDDGAFAPSPWQYVVLKIPYLTGVDRGVPLSPDSLSRCARMGDRLSHLICLLCLARSPGSSRSSRPDEFLLWQSFCCQ